MSSQEPPPFQEAARCDVCKCSFNTFRRRHHCRCCGRTLCSEHSSNQMVLPQFGLHSYVRVCLDCFNNSSSGRKVDQQASIDAANGNGDGQTFEDRIDVATDKVSRLDITAHPDMKTDLTVEQHHPVLECKCGMPLCICVPPEPSKDVAASQTISRPISTANLSTKPKRKDTSPKNRASASNIKHNSSLFSLGRVTNNNSDGSQMEYEVNGEGLREAIKNSDTAAVKELLRKGVDANYCDKQGLSLLHLAALFNKTEIAFVLMDSGASLDCKNVQGETPVDCAPATLQYKMRKKAEEEGSTGQT